MDHADIDHTGLTGVPTSNGLSTDTLWDAAGDLVVGSGANTAAKLSLGATNGMALRRVSGAVAWDLPPGYEFDYVEKTANVSVTATLEASADTIVTGSAVTYDGSTAVVIEFFMPYGRPDTGAAGRLVSIYLYDGSSSIGRMGAFITPAASNDSKPMLLRRLLTPSAAAHTYSIRATVNAGTAGLNAGSGGSGADMPGYIRITKA